MTVSNVESAVIRIGDGVTVAFDFDIEAIDAASIKVGYIVGITVVAADPADYSVSMNIGLTGGVVTFLVAPVLGEKLYIYRETDKTQVVSVSRQQSYNPAVVERVWDKLTLLVQELSTAIKRSVKTGPDANPEQLVLDLETARQQAVAAAAEASASAAAAATFDPALYVAKTTALTDIGLAGTVTVTELDYVDGVTSAIQTQLDGKLSTAGNPTLTSLSALTLAAGDILYATAADTLVNLAKGTAGQVLQMNSGATAPEWGSAGSFYYLAITADQTWNKPAGFSADTLVVFEAWGAGGGGGRADGSGDAGGGGGGCYVRKEMRYADVASSIGITIGVGGGGRSGSQGNGSAGTSTVITGVITARAGGGGGANTSGNSGGGGGGGEVQGGGTASGGGAGGAVGGGDGTSANNSIAKSIWGGGAGNGGAVTGGSAVYGGAGGGGSTSTTGGGGGVSLLGGAGGNGGTGGTANPGTAPGGGGGGAGANNNGKGGARGEVRIWIG